MTSVELQATFFKKIKENLAPHHALVDKVAEHLNISNDSAYRRIRGEKALSFDEIGILSAEFKISLDQFFTIDKDTEAFLFAGKFVSRDKADIEGFLQGLVHQLEYFNSFAEREMIYLNKDIPIFHHFMFPELASFKCYFWSRYNLNYPEYNKAPFSIADFTDLFNSLGKKISDLHLQLPSTEVWNVDCINLTIHQIDYCRESKIFASRQDNLTLYDCLEKLVDHIEAQIEAGVKFAYGQSPKTGDARYRVFINEFVIGDNMVLLQLDNTRIVSLNHNVINYIMTRDEKFANYTYDTVQSVLKKSSLISEVGEKERRLFFEKLRDKIHQCKAKV
jgi:hypothetical protein